MLRIIVQDDSLRYSWKMTPSGDLASSEGVNYHEDDNCDVFGK